MKQDTYWPDGFPASGSSRSRLARSIWAGTSRCGEPYCGDVLTLGAAVLEPRVSDQDDAALRRRLLFLLLGGPLASILLAGALEISLYVAQPGFLVAFSMHVGAAFSALIAIAASLPDVNRRGNFSDGARLLMLLQVMTLKPSAGFPTFAARSL